MRAHIHPIAGGKLKKKVFRPRLTYRELQLLRAMVNKRYRALRRSVREEREKIKAGWPDDWLDPSVEKVRDLKDLGRLLRKLNRLLIGKYTVNIPSTQEGSLIYLTEKFEERRQKINETAKKFVILGINPLLWWFYFGDKPPNKEAKCQDCKRFKECKRETRFLSPPLKCMQQMSKTFLLIYAEKLGE